MIENQIIHRRDLTIYQKMAYISLCSYANDKNICFPSYKTIADDVGCTRRKIIDVVNELVDLGLIVKRHKTTAKGDASANVYEILLGDECHAPPDEPSTPPGSAVDSSGSAYRAPEPYSNNNTNFFNNINPSIKDAAELEEIYDRCELYNWDQEIETMFQTAIDRLYYSDPFKIQNAVLPQEKVRSYLNLMDSEDITGAYDILKRNRKSVKNVIGYLMSVLINNICEKESSLLCNLPPEYLQPGGISDKTYSQ